MNKYHKLFKVLFNKYSNTIRPNVETDFMSRDKKAKYMNLGEIMKFLGDHGVIGDLLKKEEVR